MLLVVTWMGKGDVHCCSPIRGVVLDLDSFQQRDNLEGQVDWLCGHECLGTGRERGDKCLLKVPFLGKNQKVSYSHRQ